MPIQTWWTVIWHSKKKLCSFHALGVVILLMGRIWGGGFRWGSVEFPELKLMGHYKTRSWPQNAGNPGISEDLNF